MDTKILCLGMCLAGWLLSPSPMGWADFQDNAPDIHAIDGGNGAGPLEMDILRHGDEDPEGLAGGHQHGGLAGHLPGSSRNVELVGQVTVSGIVPGRISDVGVLGNHAYLGAFREPCGEGGIYVIDISEPALPMEVGFIPTAPGSFVGEGVQAVHIETELFNGDILVINNEICENTGSQIGGFSLFDVSDPLNVKPLVEGAGDTDPGGASSPANQIHSAFAWQQDQRAFVVIVDDEEHEAGTDVDIFEITDPRHPVMIAETGLKDWPDAQNPQSDGIGRFPRSFFHDVVVKKIHGDWLMLLSYWDAGYIILNVNDPARPVFINDTDFTDPDPFTGVSPPEGNAHQAEWSRDNKFILGADEDFSPERLVNFAITTGPDAGEYTGDVIGFGRAVSTLPDGVINGPTVFGGYGCNEDVADIPDPSVLGLRDPDEESILVLQRGPDNDPNHPHTPCRFDEQAQNAHNAGYDAVIIANHHAGADGGRSPDAVACGTGDARDILALCTSHRVMHLLFGRAEDYSLPYPVGDPDDLEPAPGVLGEMISATAQFDGWGYLHLFDAETLEEIDVYAIAQSLDPFFSDNFGDLSVHEVATDPERDLAYLSYYAGGLRVLKFGEDGLEEVGHYIDPDGNNFWGVQVHRVGSVGAGNDNQTLILASDRDSGLWIFRFTGDD